MKIREVGHFLFALVVLLPLCMCGGVSVDENNDRTFLSIGSAPPGGSFFIVGGALADVLGTHGGKGQWIVTAEATKGSLENIRRLDHGELELSLANSGITYFAVNGTEGWERPYPMMSLMTLAPNAMVFVTPETAGIETIGDLVGERVVVGVAGAGWEFFLRPILNAHGVFYEDFTPLYNTQTGATTTIMGTGESGDETNAADGLRTQLNRPHGVYVSADGALYVSDSYNHRILKVTEF